MKRFKQLVANDPDNRILGDSYRTAIACVLDMHPSEIPHFTQINPTHFRQLARDHLRAQGLELIVVRYPSLMKLDEVLKTNKSSMGNLYYLLTGLGPRGYNHVVVAQGNKIVHDPYFEGGGLVGPCNDSKLWWVEIIVQAPTPIVITKAFH